MTDDPIFFRFPNYKGTGAAQVSYNGKDYDVQTTAANHIFTVENPPARSLRVVKTNASAKEGQTDLYLAGAKFQISQGGTVLYTGESDDYGVVQWKQTDTDEPVAGLQLPEGIYLLEETDAPDGYIKLAAPIEFAVDASGKVTVADDAYAVSTDGNVITISVPNQSSYELPESGGAGTTMLYVLGSALVLSAAMALVCDSRRRKAKN